MRRVLLVTTSYPEHEEGEAAAGVFVRDFACAMLEAGVSIEVIAPAMVANFQDEGGVTVTRFAVPRLPLSLLNPMHIQDWKAIFTTLAQGARAVSDLCSRRRPDHILALWALPSGAWALRASRIFGIPYSTWALGSDIWTLGSIPVLRQYLAHVMRNADHRFSDGYQLAGDVTQICGCPCAFLPSSRNFGPSGLRTINVAPPYRFAFLGRWHSNKGVDMLLGALSRLDNAVWLRIEAVRIHGGGPLERQVHDSVAKLVAAGRPVEIGGYLDLAGARALFEWTDFVVIPSRIESIPVVFSDAMQARRPVIATPVGDLPQLISSLKCGVLARSADEAGIAEAIRQAVDTPSHEYEQGLTNYALAFDVLSAVRSFLAMTTK